MVLALKSNLISFSWNKEQKEAEIWFLSVFFKKPHVKQDHVHACLCLQWNHVLKRTQLHYIYNCVAPTFQLPACLLVVAHVSILCVLISVLKYAALKKVDICPFPLLTKPHPSRDFPRLLLWSNEGSCSDMLGSLQERVWPAGDQPLPLYGSTSLYLESCSAWLV